MLKNIQIFILNNCFYHPLVYIIFIEQLQLLAVASKCLTSRRSLKRVEWKLLRMFFLCRMWAYSKERELVLEMGRFLIIYPFFTAASQNLFDFFPFNTQHAIKVQFSWHKIHSFKIVVKLLKRRVPFLSRTCLRHGVEVRKFIAKV